MLLYVSLFKKFIALSLLSSQGSVINYVGNKTVDIILVKANQSLKVG